ncbi:MAG: hypothetical protein ACFFED_07290 [Candidatus Thorarchaeota archaeon]
MSIAKKAVDSTLKKILIYTGEIIASIILLIVICLPLAFSVPMWIQRVFFGTPVNELLVNPLAWFGSAGLILVVAGLAVVSIIIGYPFLMKLIPGKTSENGTVVEDDKEEEVTMDDEEEIDDAEELEDEEFSDSIDEDEISEEDVSDSTIDN